MSFPLVANEKVKLTVQSWISSNRIPHAILIEGETGLGKHTLALYLAAAAVCNNSNAPCGNCDNCKLCFSANHPDIITIAPLENKKSISVAQIKELKNEAFVKPHTANKKVFVIDNGDTLKEDSQNTILKLLEEPPECVMFIIIAETKASFLDTIISRCTVLTLNTPDEANALEYISGKTKKSEQEIINALQISKNNIGRALKVLRGAATKTELAATEFLTAFLNANEYEMLKIAARFEKDRVNADKFLSNLKYQLVAQLRKKPNGVFSSQIVKFYSLIPEFEKSLKLNINLNLLFCSMVSKAKQISEEL